MIMFRDIRRYQTDWSRIELEYVQCWSEAEAETTSDGAAFSLSVRDWHRAAPLLVFLTLWQNMNLT